MRRVLTIVAGVCLTASVLQAQGDHPIDVERALARGEFFEALALYDRLPKRQVTDTTTLAAARAAWGLGLTQRSHELFDEVLRLESLDSTQRARVLMSQGIIALQGGQVKMAAVLAERAAAQLTTPSPLRGNIFILWGDALREEGSPGLAQEQYVRALAEVEPESRPEIEWRRGETALLLGSLADARASFERIPVRHERAAQGLRRLAEIALREGRWDEVPVWIAKGEERDPALFLDGWSAYARARAALGKGDAREFRRLSEDAIQKLPPSDGWRTVLEAMVERSAWRERGV